MGYGFHVEFKCCSCAILFGVMAIILYKKKNTVGVSKEVASNNILLGEGRATRKNNI